LQTPLTAGWEPVIAASSSVFRRNRILTEYTASRRK
jgi:hypothetical protein